MKVKKRCGHCHKKKDISEFYKRKKNYDGLHTWCLQCTREYSQNKYTKPVKWSSVLKDRLTIDESPRCSITGNIEVKCFKCGKYFEPGYLSLRNRCNVIIGKRGGHTENHLYCSDKCKYSCEVFGINPNNLEPADKPIAQIARRNQHISKRQIIFENGYKCERCGKEHTNLYLHHTEPVAKTLKRDDISSEEALKIIKDSNSHMVVCEKCHLLIHSSCT